MSPDCLEILIFDLSLLYFPYREGRCLADLQNFFLISLLYHTIFSRYLNGHQTQVACLSVSIALASFSITLKSLDFAQSDNKRRPKMWQIFSLAKWFVYIICICCVVSGNTDYGDTRKTIFKILQIITPAVTSSSHWSSWLKYF